MNKQQIERMVAIVRSCAASPVALLDEGFPSGYAQAFQNVANQQKCVISTRTPGKSCAGLLGEGYDAKGFHIKGKSCNWGPMAGFICLDPLLNKNGLGGAEGNLKNHHHSLMDAYEGNRAASVTQAIISDHRLNWLVTKGYLSGVSTLGNGNQMHGIAQSKSGGANDPPVVIDYVLSKTPIGSGVGWAIYYHRAGLTGMRNTVLQLNAGHGAKQAEIDLYQQSVALSNGPNVLRYQNKDYEPLCALVNPHPPYKTNLTYYKNGITGDFDLFALWPYTGRGSHYDATLDERMAGMDHTPYNNNLERTQAINNMRDRVFQNEHLHMGNISERGILIGQLLNAAMAAFIPGSVKPNRVFHSDEGGRPGQSALELPAAAFIPGHRTGYLLRTAEQVKQFAMYCKRAGYKIFANIAWVDEIGRDVVSASPQIQNLLPNIPRPPQRH